MRRTIALSAVLGLALLVPAANAATVPNPGYVKATYPTGVPVNPKSTDLSGGPVATTISSILVNQKAQAQTIKVYFVSHHVLTYDGRDVRDGTETIDLTGDNYKRTTQAIYNSQSQDVTVAANGRTAFSFTVMQGMCGEFQLDLNARTASGDKYRLTGLFTRATGCPPPLTYGICHYAGNSGQYIYFPVPEQTQAALQHYKHLLDGTHPNDYLATDEDRAHYDLHKNGQAENGDGTGTTRKCVSTPPEPVRRTSTMITTTFPLSREAWKGWVA